MFPANYFLFCLLARVSTCNQKPDFRQCPRRPPASVLLPETRAETKLACRQSTDHVFPEGSSEVKGSVGQGGGKVTTRGVVIIELVTNVGH